MFDIPSRTVSFVLVFSQRKVYGYCNAIVITEESKSRL